MNQSYKLRLLQPLRAWAAVAGTLLLTIVIGRGIDRLIPAGAGTGIWVLTCLLGGFALAYFGVRWWGVRAAEVEVDADYLRIHYPDRQSTVSLRWDNVASYRYEPFNDRAVLCFRQRNGSKVKLLANGTFGPIGDFTALVQAIEQLIEQRHLQQQREIRREKTFFERPIATVLLVVNLLLVGLIIGKLITEHKPVTGGLITTLGLLLSYGAAWYAARRHS